MINLKIDKLTNCLIDLKTGEEVKTDIKELSRKDLQSISKRAGWLFDWKIPFGNNSIQVYKLLVKKSIHTIQGLIALERQNTVLQIHLAESAPWNRSKSQKTYEGVGGHLFAFACLKSLEYGFKGEVAFTAKTALIQYYIKELGATQFYTNRMGILEDSAAKLITKYYGDGKRQ